MSIAEREELARLRSALHNIIELGISALSTVTSLIERGGDYEAALREIERCMESIEMLRNDLVRGSLIYMARFQPIGYELKLVHSIIDVSYDIFRIVRYCREIALVLSIARLGPSDISRECLEAVSIARDMVMKAVESLERESVEGARLVMEMDQRIDQIYRESMKILEPGNESLDRRAAASLFLIRHLERIADHATYIAKKVFALRD